MYSSLYLTYRAKLISAETININPKIYPILKDFGFSIRENIAIEIKA